MKSLMLRAGTDGCTTSTDGPIAIDGQPVTGGELRDRLGADNAGLVLALTYLTAEERRNMFGVTYERWHMGVFIEAGARWTPRLVRNDNDLRPLGVEMINNTGARIFMPANVGLMLRF